MENGRVCIWLPLIYLGNMVACIDAAAECSLNRVFCCYCYFLFCSNWVIPTASTVWKSSYASEYCTNVPYWVPSSTRRRYWQRKQEHRVLHEWPHWAVGIADADLTWLRQAPHKPPLPGLFIANPRLLSNIMDELRFCLTLQTHILDNCVMILTEMWLQPVVPDTAIWASRPLNSPQ